jgi:pyridoxal phosphate enzyme (YggS family)
LAAAKVNRPVRSDSPFVQARLTEIRARIAAAAPPGRDPAGIAVVAVTKYLAPERMRELRAAGLGIFGENRAREALAKLEYFAAQPPERRPREWHFIGTLQGNKVREVVGRFDLIHSLDRMETARRVSQAAVERGIAQRALLQACVSGEESKHGFAPGELEQAWPELAALPGLRLEGLMGMAAALGDPRPAFRALRALRDRLDPGAARLRELSMGMSGDFEAAVAEGATLLRIGTLLYSEEAGA